MMSERNEREPVGWGGGAKRSCGRRSHSKWGGGGTKTAAGRIFFNDILSIKGCDAVDRERAKWKRRGRWGGANREKKGFGGAPSKTRNRRREMNAEVRHNAARGTVGPTPLPSLPSRGPSTCNPFLRTRYICILVTAANCCCETQTERRRRQRKRGWKWRSGGDWG